MANCSPRPHSEGAAGASSPRETTTKHRQTEENHEDLHDTARLLAPANNLALARDIPRFTHTMIGILPRIMPNFRLHVSGDFFNADYCSAWFEICKAFPQTRFWGYTRSWANPEMREALERLRDLPNMQLLASTDPTMPLPPDGWRVAFVLTDPRARGMLCNFQGGEEDSCLACGYCFERDKGNVIFKVH